MALRIFNSLNRKKDEFAPLRPGEARVYVCGVTVYDLSHIGHARSAIVFDVVNRYLRFNTNAARDQVAHGTARAGAFLIGVVELLALARVLGLLGGAGPERVVIDPQLKARVDSLVYLRQEARKQRDFAEADRLRDELTRLGVLLDDTPGGTSGKLR